MKSSSFGGKGFTRIKEDIQYTIYDLPSVIAQSSSYFSSQWRCFYPWCWDVAWCFYPMCGCSLTLTPASLSGSISSCRTEPPPCCSHRASKADPHQRQHCRQTRAGESNGAQPPAGNCDEKKVSFSSFCFACFLLCSFLVFFACALVNILPLTLFISVNVYTVFSSRNKSSWFGSQTCNQSCAPVATASPIWTMRSTLWTRPSTLWPESWSWRAKRCCGSGVKPTTR